MCRHSVDLVLNDGKQPALIVRRQAVRRRPHRAQSRVALRPLSRREGWSGGHRREGAHGVASGALQRIVAPLLTPAKSEPATNAILGSNLPLRKRIGGGRNVANPRLTSKQEIALGFTSPCRGWNSGTAKVGQLDGQATSHTVHTHGDSVGMGNLYLRSKSAPSYPAPPLSRHSGTNQATFI